MLPRLVPEEENGYSLGAHFPVITQLTKMSQLFFLYNSMPIREITAWLYSWYCNVACLRCCQTASFLVQSHLNKILRVAAWSVIVCHQWAERDSLRLLLHKKKAKFPPQIKKKDLAWITVYHVSYMWYITVALIHSNTV